MRGPRSMRRLARTIAAAPEGVDMQTALELLGGLTRAELKTLVSALREEASKRSVQVSVAGPADAPVAEGLAPLYVGRTLEVSTEPSLGAGLRVTAGDDVIDASVKGMIRAAVDGMKRQ